MKFWSHIINPVNSTNIINPHIIVRKSEPKKTVTTHQLHKILTVDETERMKETHLRLGLKQVDLKLGKQKWLDPNLITCVVLKMSRIGVSRYPIWNLQMKREERLRRAKILEAMIQTEQSVLLLGKITRNFHCFFYYYYTFSQF